MREVRRWVCTRDDEGEVVMGDREEGSVLKTDKEGSIRDAEGGGHKAAEEPGRRMLGSMTIASPELCFRYCTESLFVASQI